MDTLEKFVNFIGSLIGAIKEGCSTEDVAHRYKDMFRAEIRYTEMGYNSLEDLLKVCEQRGKIYRRGGRWFVKATDDNKHMVDLINNTKSTVTRNKKGNIKYYERMTPKAKFAKVPHASQFKAQLKPEPKISTKSSSGNYQVENPNDCPLPPPPGFKDKTGRYEEEPVDDFANAGGAFSSCRPNEKSNSPSVSSFGNSVGIASRQRFAKGYKRLRATVEMCGGETSLSSLKEAYEERYHIPLDSAEFHRLFGVDISNPERLRRILDGCLDLKEEYDEWVFSVPADELDDDLFDAVDDLPTVNKTLSHQEGNAYGDGNEGTAAASYSSLQGSHRPSPSPGVNCYGPKRVVCHREDEAFGSRHDTRLNRDSHVDSTESQKASSSGELDYMSLGSKIFDDVIYNGPIKIDALGDFFFNVHRLRINPVTSGDGSWIGIVKRIMDTGRFPSLIICRNEIGLREHFLEVGHTKEEEDELLAANLAYRILKNSDGRMLYLALFDDLRKWDITFDHVLFYKFITKFSDTFECEFSTNGHFLYLTEGAKPPSPNGVMPNSTILSPIVCTDVLSTYRSGELPEKKPINLAKLDVVPYRDGMRRFKFIFSLSDFDVKKKKFHAELYEYYNSHWQDEDLMMKLKVGDHAVFYDPIRDYVRRIYYVEEEENGSLRVYLIDDLIYASTMPSQIRKLTEKFASVPSFGVVEFSAPFHFFDQSGSEFWRTFDKVRERLSEGASSTTPAFIRLYSKPEEGVRRVMHLFHEPTKTSFPNCLIADSFIQLQDKKWKFYNSREEEPDDDMWNSGCES